MRLIEHVLGNRTDAALAERLHRLDHRGALDSLTIKAAETERRRFRAVTERGEDVAIALPRDQGLHDGAVLALEEDWALVVRVSTPRWLRLVPRDAAAAIELGYNAGNLHWRVKFDGPALLVALEGPPEAYRVRLQRMIDAGAVTFADDTAC